MESAPQRVRKSAIYRVVFVSVGVLSPLVLLGRSGAGCSAIGVEQFTACGTSWVPVITRVVFERLAVHRRVVEGEGAQRTGRARGDDPPPDTIHGSDGTREAAIGQPGATAYWEASSSA